MMFPEYVGKNFSESALSYDDAALFQRQAAESFSEFIRSKSSDFDKKLRILEIGCGTGFMTERILSLFPDSQFVISDISEAMLDVCMAKLNSSRKMENRNILFKKFDASKTIHGSDYDIVISAMTFQWFSDIGAVLELIKSKMVSGGTLFFSTLENETFSRMKNVFAELGEKYPVPDFPSMDSIQKCVNDLFSEAVLERHRYNVSYPSIAEFLDSLRATGAVNASGNAMKVSSLRRIMKFYSSRYSSAEEEYRLVMASCRK